MYYINTFVKAAGELMDGKTLVIGGISGTIKYTEYTAIYPYERLVQRINHQPDAKGKATAAYKELRAMLGDDWDTDLTDSERLGQYAIELGIQPDELLAQMALLDKEFNQH